MDRSTDTAYLELCRSLLVERFTPPVVGRNPATVSRELGPTAQYQQYLEAQAGRDQLRILDHADTERD